MGIYQQNQLENIILTHFSHSSTGIKFVVLNYSIVFCLRMSSSEQIGSSPGISPVLS